MNREIKYRGISIETNKMVYGSLVNNIWQKSELTDSPGEPTCEIVITENDYDNWEDIVSNDNIVEVKPNTVGQYTGLKDKNGKEIYEGDILEYEYNLDTRTKKKFREEVEWCKSNNCIGFDIHTDMDFKIIGNIYMHSELIKA